MTISPTAALFARHLTRLIVAAVLFAATALGLPGPPAQADDVVKIPNASCTPSTDCYQSYLYGRDWSMAKWRYLTGHLGMRNVIGTGPDHPEVARDFCRGVEADVTSIGHPPGDLYHFRGGCMDTVLNQWIATSLDAWTAVSMMMGARTLHYEHSSYYPAAPYWETYGG
jgi:hypothetical protein